MTNGQYLKLRRILTELQTTCNNIAEAEFGFAGANPEDSQLATAVSDVATHLQQVIDNHPVE